MAVKLVDLSGVTRWIGNLAGLPAPPVTSVFGRVGNVVGAAADYNGKRLTGLVDPAAAQDAATKAYVDATGIPQGGPLTADLLSGNKKLRGAAAAGGEGGLLDTRDASVAGAGGLALVAGGVGAAGQAGGRLVLAGGDGDGGGVSGALLTLQAGAPGVPGVAQFQTHGSGGSAGEAVVSDALGGVKYGGVQVAAGVPAGGPTGLPFAYDTTAVTGGFYFWNGGAWVKIATIL